ADDLGEDVCAAAPGELEVLENKYAGTFADDEAVAILVPRATGPRGIIVASGKCAHGGKSANSHGCDGAFSASGDHYVSVATLDDLVGIANGMCAGGASGRSGFVRTLRAISDTDVPGGKVHDSGRNEKWRDLTRSTFKKCFVLALDDVETTNAGADVHSDA